MRFKETSDDLATIERAKLDAYQAFAAQLLVATRNFLRDQIAVSKPLIEWTVEDVITAVKARSRRN
jgi:hypothetical protein